MTSSTAKLFSDVFTDSVDIVSSWSNVLATNANKQAQTEALAVKDVAIQSKIHRDYESQTDDGIGDSEDVSSSSSSSLAAFLAKVAPVVEDQLYRNSESSAFDDYNVCWDESRDSVLSLYYLKRKLTAPTTQASGKEKAATVVQMSAYCLCWNSTGHSIAIGYGCTDHSNLCSHTGAICGWNLARKFVKEDTPDFTIETPACVTAIAFHPTNTTLLAAGTFNGGVFVWDMSKGTDSPLYSNVLLPQSHREPIAKMQWIADPIDRDSKLLSVAGDGKVHLWSLSNHFAKPVASLDISVDGSRLAVARGFRPLSKTLGGSAIDVPKTEPGTFYVATEGGEVFKCLVDFQDISHRARTQSDSSSGLKASVAFDPHSGPITAVHCSPFARKVVAATGVDGECRIYNTLSGSPFLKMRPSAHSLYDVQWSPSRPHVVAVAAADGYVQIYDLQQQTLGPKQRLSVMREDDRGKDEECAALALAFNPVFSDLLAAGAVNGCVHIWQLNSSLTELNASEIELFNKMAEL